MWSEESLLFSRDVVFVSCYAVMMCVIGGVSDSGVGVSETSMPISSKYCGRLRSQQLDVSPICRCSDPP